MNTTTITAGAWAPPATGLLLGGTPAIAPATHYDDAYNAYAYDDAPAWDVDAAAHGHPRPPCCSALLALATGNWQPFFDGLTRGARGARIFPEFECAGDAPF